MTRHHRQGGVGEFSSEDHRLLANMMEKSDRIVFTCLAGCSSEPAQGSFAQVKAMSIYEDP